MFCPAVNKGKSQVFSNVELFFDGVHHRGREGLLVPALLWREDAGRVPLVDRTLLERPFADAHQDVVPHAFTEQSSHFA